MLQLNDVPGSAFFDAEEAFVGVCLLIAAAHRFEFLWAYLGASFECECGQTAFHWHNEHVFAAILFAHMAFGTIQFVVGSANKRWRLFITIGIAMRGGRTILQRNGHNARSARFLLQFAHRAINVAIGTANGAILIVFGRAFVRALEDGRFECCASANMSQIYAASESRRREIENAFE